MGNICLTSSTQLCVWMAHHWMQSCPSARSNLALGRSLLPLLRAHPVQALLTQRHLSVEEGQLTGICHESCTQQVISSLATESCAYVHFTCAGNLLSGRQDHAFAIAPRPLSGIPSLTHYAPFNSQIRSGSIVRHEATHPPGHTLHSDPGSAFPSLPPHVAQSTSP